MELGSKHRMYQIFYCHLIYIGRANILIVPSGTEIVFCTKSLDGISYENTNASTDQEEINSFGLKIFKQIYPRDRKFDLSQFSSIWLFLNPSEELKRSRNDKLDDRISLKNHDVTLAFGSLVSPYHFKCAQLEFLFTTNTQSNWKIFFAKHNSFIGITVENARFHLKQEHIDNNRGVIIDVKSIFNIVVHICLRGNLDEYTLQSGGNGILALVEKNVEDLFFFSSCVNQNKFL